MAEQNAQENTLLAVLEQLKAGNEGTKSATEETKEVVKEVRKQRSDLGKTHNWNKKKAAEDGKVNQWLKGYFGWAKKAQERAAKLAKIGAKSAVEFGKEKLSSVQKFAGNMLDLLLKGLGLAALWALFKFLSENSWEETIAKVKGWLKDIGIEWDNAVAVLDGIWIVLTRISGSFWVFKGTLGLIRTWFGLMGPVNALWTWMLSFGFNRLFGERASIRQMFRWIGSIFSGEGKIAQWLKGIKVRALWMMIDVADTPMGKFVGWIRSFFGGNGRIAEWLKTIKESAKFQKWFGETSKLREIFRWIGSFFGSADEGGKIAKAIQSITQNKLVQGIGKFLGSIGGKMLKFFGPIGWLMAGYDAVMAFWETFQSTEGSLWDKTVAGLSAGIQAIVDFFVFDMIGLAEKGVKWLIKKILGLFGFDENEVEKSEAFQFSITGFLKDWFGDLMTFFEGIFSWDVEKIKEGLKGIYGGAADIIGWLFDIAIKPAINWLGEFFGLSKEGEDLISKDFSLSKWIKENLINPIVDFLGNLLNLDFMAMAKQLMPGPLFNWIFGSSGDEASEAAFKKGAFIDDAGYNSVDTEKLKAMLEEGSKSDQQKLMAGLVSAYKDNTGNLDDENLEQLGKLLNEYGASLNRGGFIPAGKTVPAVLHGPELVKPLPDLESAGASGGGATTVAPTTIVNKSSGSTTMMMGSSSIDKSSWKYGMQGA